MVIMKEVNFIENSEWALDKKLYINGISKNCIECCFSKDWLNCVVIRAKLNIPMYLCGVDQCHYERKN